MNKVRLTKQKENRINNILARVISISNMLTNLQMNNISKRRIRRYKTLSK